MQSNQGGFNLELFDTWEHETTTLEPAQKHWGDSMSIFRLCVWEGQGPWALEPALRPQVRV